MFLSDETFDATIMIAQKRRSRDSFKFDVNKANAKQLLVEYNHFEGKAANQDIK
jgi:hypothetical protein